MSALRKKAGPKPKYGGTYTIKHARQLFEQSCADGCADYRYVAIAIGSTPGAPPDWAIWACIEARRDAERSAARGNDTDIPSILDDIVRFYDRKQREFEHNNKETPDALENYVVPPLQEAIQTVLKDAQLRRNRDTKGNGDWFRDIRNAWDWEQENDPSPDATGWMALQGLMKKGKGKGKLEPIKGTARIYRVLMETMAHENGDPEDVNTWAWVAKRVIEERTINKQAILPSKTELTYPDHE